jgi:hypothetical protein
LYLSYESCTTIKGISEYNVIYTTFIKDNTHRVLPLRRVFPILASKQQDADYTRLTALYYQAIQRHEVYAITLL